MWISLGNPEVALVIQALETQHRLTQDMLVLGIIALIKSAQRELNDPENQAFIEAHRERYSQHSWTDGDIDFDSSPMVSYGDGGAYVMMWGWVSNELAGFPEDENDEKETCSTCGAVEGSEEWGTVGDGYNGECPSCANKTEAQRHDI